MGQSVFPERTKFPFWSAIITQVQGSVNIPATTEVFVDIQPAANETWWVEIGFSGGNCNINCISYYDYNGITARMHFRNVTHTTYEDNRNVTVHRILTNSLYARIGFNNAGTSAFTAFYGYSGFKLSQPQWSTRKVTAEQEIAFKCNIPKNKGVAFPQLREKAYLNPEGKLAYHLCSDVLAVDPIKNVPVETVEYHVTEEDLVARLVKFKADSKGSGWEKIFTKLKEENISL